MDTEAAYAEGIRALAAGDVSKAEALGQQLVSLQFSGGYELLALCFTKTDRPDLAERVLDEGTKRAPTVWSLWQLLGQVYSAGGRFEESLQAYHKARSCPDPDLEQLELNSAITEFKRGQPRQASERLEALLPNVREASLRVSVARYLALSLVEQDRLMEALIWLGEGAFSDEENSQLLFELAQSCQRRGEVEDAVRLARQAYGLTQHEMAKTFLERAGFEA